MKTGVAAAALAASALLAPTATAQIGDSIERAVAADQLRGGPSESRNRNDFRDRSDRRDRANRRDRQDRRDQRRDRRDRAFHGPQLNAFGQTYREARNLADEAAYACACQLELDGHRYGYQDAGFRGTPYIEQVGKRRFIIKGTVKLYDGYNYSAQHYECNVRRGDIRGATRLSPAQYASRRNRRRGRSLGGFSFSFGNGW